MDKWQLIYSLWIQADRGYNPQVKILLLNIYSSAILKSHSYQLL
jgi:hypothetical protein